MSKVARARRWLDIWLSALISSASIDAWSLELEQWLILPEVAGKITRGAIAVELERRRANGAAYDACRRIADGTTAAHELSA